MGGKCCRGHRVAQLRPAKETGSSDAIPRCISELDSPDAIFHYCDATQTGFLDDYELGFGMKAFGIRLSRDELREKVKQFGHSGCSLAQFKRLLQDMLASIPANGRHPRAVPHALRGISFDQLQHIEDAYVLSGWLGQQCEAFNCEHAAEISEGKEYARHENMYALDKLIVRPVTSLSDHGSLPKDLKVRACQPEPTHDCSYAELVNPTGLPVHFFVSHFWGHLFRDTMRALNLWVQHAVTTSGQTLHGVAPGSVVFWVCVFALNQHNVAEEVGSSPEEGPFNAALVLAREGAIMILDERVEPFRRIWCLYEVQRLTTLGRPLELICSEGPVRSLADQATTNEGRIAAVQYLTDIGTGLSELSAASAASSSKGDKLAIWKRIAEPWARNWSEEQFEQKATAEWFTTFDAKVSALLVAPLLQESLQRGDLQNARRYLGLGASFSSADIDRLQQIGADPRTLTVPMRHADEVSQGPLLAAAARFKHEDAVAALLALGAPVDAVDEGQWAYAALHWAAAYDFTHIVSTLLDAQASIDLPARDTHDIGNAWTPLSLAAFLGDSALCAAKMLLDRGADLQATDTKGWTALHQAVDGCHLQMASMLLERGARVDAKGDNGQTPLWATTHNDSLSMAQLLLDYRADPSTQDDNLATPLLGAANLGSHGVATLLLKSSVDVQAANKNGTTALHYASGKGHKEVVELLLNSRADSNVMNTSDETPLHLAEANGHDDVASLLWEASDHVAAVSL
ncbi:unnamed protein product [Polarella glacialis]|uniref:Uncharacterized protein n=1 Tax=Polarella glacialis TaxID=89957 RepID=A0A813EJ93_POLGL|nr:unnamed protein product [Polarella glacialis]CAE8721722.1 unnamed protein product [Polarella glacialis]